MPADVRTMMRLAEVDEHALAARRDGSLAMAVFEAALLPGRRRLTLAGLSEVLGVHPSMVGEIWRALGFPPVDEAEPLFSDVGALDAAASMFDFERTTPDMALAQSRAVGSALARVAEVLVDALAVDFGEVESEGVVDEVDQVARVLERTDLAQVRAALDYVFRLQLVAALRRRLLDATTAGPDQQVVCVGFADLAGFTALSQRVDVDDLGALLSRFEAVTHDVITAHGGRVVKTIGDEVMFAAIDPHAGARIALDLVEVIDADEMLPRVRIGVDHGLVLARDGDFFGTVVNRANRIVSVTRGGRIVVTDAVADEVRDEDGIELRSLGRRRLRDLGAVTLHRMERAPV